MTSPLVKDNSAYATTVGCLNLLSFRPPQVSELIRFPLVLLVAALPTALAPTCNNCPPVQGQSTLLTIRSGASFGPLSPRLTYLLPSLNAVTTLASKKLVSTTMFAFRRSTLSGLLIIKFRIGELSLMETSLRPLTTSAAPLLKLVGPV
jgi:hypothetical protein